MLSTCTIPSRFPFADLQGKMASFPSNAEVERKQILVLIASLTNLFNKVGFVPGLVGVCLGWRCFYFYLDVPARWIAIGKGNRLHLRNAHTP